MLCRRCGAGPWCSKLCMRAAFHDRGLELLMLPLLMLLPGGCSSGAALTPCTCQTQGCALTSVSSTTSSAGAAEVRAYMTTCGLGAALEDGVRLKTVSPPTPLRCRYPTCCQQDTTRQLRNRTGCVLRYALPQSFQLATVCGGPSWSCTLLTTHKLCASWDALAQQQQQGYSGEVKLLACAATAATTQRPWRRPSVSGLSWDAVQQVRVRLC